MTWRASGKSQFPYGFFCWASLLIWAIATVILRLWGHLFFIADNPWSVEGSFLFSLLCLPTLTYGLFRWQRVQPDRQGDAAICLALPGMLLDAVATYFFASLFPNLSPNAVSAFGAWLLWGYALILVTGLVAGHPRKSPVV
ncbi:MAG: DUF5367 domain-containing protein [Coleofasciculaceae cyanobacterium SM2_3_26]|nr:DUF5367 domain-containing protein [Coleofasciculaceae cyanobacterium SM2_3_26]